MSQLYFEIICILKKKSNISCSLLILMSLFLPEEASECDEPLAAFDVYHY